MFFERIKKLNNQTGVTIIELVIVITVLGIVSGVTISTINVQRQHDIAADSMAKDRIQKVAEAIEVFGVLHDRYPDECSGGNPTTCNADLDGLISDWPSEAYQFVSEDGADVDSDPDMFAVYIESPIDSTKFYKYSSVWTQDTDESDDAAIKDCTPDLINVVDFCNPYGTVYVPPALSSVEVELTLNSLNPGQSTNATAKAIYNNGTEVNISTDSGTNWSSSNSFVAGVQKNSNDVDVDANHVGTANIMAAYQGRTGSDTLTVIYSGAEPADDVLTVTAGTTNLTVGGTTSLTALYNGTNVNNQAEWTSGSPSIVDVRRTGNNVTATGMAPGTSVISVSYEGLTTNITITVSTSGGTPPQQSVLQRVEVTSQRTIIGLDDSEQMTAIAVFSDGSTQNVTNSAIWSTPWGAEIASVSSTGLVTSGFINGTERISARYSSGTTVTGSKDITVSSGGSGDVPCQTHYDCSDLECPGGGAALCSYTLHICICPDGGGQPTE